MSVPRNRQPSCVSLVAHEEGRTTDSGEMTVSLYENEVPSFIEKEMEELYENVFSSFSKARVESDGRNASAYVVRMGSKVTTVFLFWRRDRKVEVINEAIPVNEEDVRLFSDTIFSAFPSVTAITFRAVQASICRLPFPYQRFNCLEDIVLTLPATPQAYLASLGKSTRQNIKYYLKAFQRSFPSYRFEILVKSEVSEQHVREIVRLSGARMAVKKKISLHDEKKTKQLIELVRMHGFVAVETIDGRVCAGVICTRSGANYFMHVIAHDPEYDRYSLGTLCCYLTICECIERSGKEFHFLWGRLEYKYRFLGLQRELDRVAVYRSPAQFMLNGDIALKIAFRGYGRQLKRWLLDPKRTNSLIGRALTKGVEGVRKLSRFSLRFSTGRDDDSTN